MEQENPQPSSSDFISLGLNLAVGMIFFLFLGHHLDQKRGDGIMFKLLGIILGLAYGAYEVWKAVRRLDEEHKK